jgi:hypothetical protein
MLRPLLVVVSLAAAPALAEPARALIWSGRATAEAGAAALAEVPPKLGALLALGAGFPKVVESRSIAGLKPGFFIVLLGLCGPTEAELPLLVAKSVDRRVYARPVEVAREALACPALAGKWKVADRALGKVSHVRLVNDDEGARIQRRGDADLAPWRLMVWLRDDAGELLDLDVVTDDDYADEPALTPTPAGLTARFVLYGGRDCEGVSAHTAHTLTFSAKGKRLSRATSVGRESCD